MPITQTPREDAHAKAAEWAAQYPEATIGCYPMGGREWMVLATLPDGSAVTSVFTPRALAPAMLEAARRAGVIAFHGHSPDWITHRPATTQQAAERAEA